MESIQLGRRCPHDVFEGFQSFAYVLLIRQLGNTPSRRRTYLLRGLFLLKQRNDGCQGGVDGIDTFVGSFSRHVVSLNDTASISYDCINSCLYSRTTLGSRSFPCVSARRDILRRPPDVSRDETCSVRGNAFLWIRNLVARGPCKG